MKQDLMCHKEMLQEVTLSSGLLTERCYTMRLCKLFPTHMPDFGQLLWDSINVLRSDSVTSLPPVAAIDLINYQGNIASESVPLNHRVSLLFGSPVKHGVNHTTVLT